MRGDSCECGGVGNGSSNGNSRWWGWVEVEVEMEEGMLAGVRHLSAREVMFQLPAGLVPTGLLPSLFRIWLWPRLVG